MGKGRGERRKGREKGRGGGGEGGGGGGGGEHVIAHAASGLGEVLALRLSEIAKAKHKVIKGKANRHMVANFTAAVKLQVSYSHMVW